VMCTMRFQVIPEFFSLVFFLIKYLYKYHLWFFKLCYFFIFFFCIVLFYYICFYYAGKKKKKTPAISHVLLFFGSKTWRPVDAC
jgi:positive regulator of sigma E activity